MNEPEQIELIGLNGQQLLKAGFTETVTAFPGVTYYERDTITVISRETTNGNVSYDVHRFVNSEHPKQYINTVKNLNQLFNTIHVLYCFTEEITESFAEWDDAFFQAGYDLGTKDAQIICQPVNTGEHTLKAYQDITARLHENVHCLIPTNFQLAYGFAFDHISSQKLYREFLADIGSESGMYPPAYTDLTNEQSDKFCAYCQQKNDEIREREQY